MISIPFIGTVKGGKFIADDREAFKRAFWVHEGKRVKLEVKRYFKKRSLKQNDYYHGKIVQMLSDFLGYEPDEMHNTLKAKFNSKPEIVRGKEVNRVMSTASLTTDEFTNYMDRIKRWASIEFNLYIPDPNEE